MKKLLNYLFKGGIQGRFFIGCEPVKPKIYEIKGYARLYNSVPWTICVDICKYDLSSNKVYRYNEILESLLEYEEATKEQIRLIPPELKACAKELPKSKEEPYIPF